MRWFFAMLTLTAVFAASAGEDIPQLKPLERLASTSKEKGRGPGPFGDEYWWANRFLTKYNERQALKGGTADLVLLGDSITHFWEWLDPSDWKTFTAGKRVINFGYGGDIVQNVIWRINHGELDGYKAKNVALMIGTNNNFSPNSNPTNLAIAIEHVVDMIREKQPAARVLLHLILPRGASPTSKLHAEPHKRNLVTNALLREFARTRKDVTLIDLTDAFTGPDGWVPRDLMADELHPTPKGYRLWAAALSSYL